jgi:hypothetical protein
VDNNNMANANVDQAAIAAAAAAAVTGASSAATFASLCHKQLVAHQ